MTPNPSEMCAAPPARSPKPEALWKKYQQTGDTSAEEALVREYLPLVRTVAGRLAMSLPSHVSADDLLSAGMVGLLQALRTFNARRGASFETFARFRIRGAVLDELRRMDWVPRTVHDKARKIQNTLGELEQRLGALPSEAETAQALGLTLEEYQTWLDEVRPVTFVCLDAASQGSAFEAATPHDSIPDESQESPFESASRHELMELIADRLRCLPPIQQKVLALYYFEDLRLREIAEVFEVTESRISQIHSQAILAIRAQLERQEAGLACVQAGGQS